MKYIIYLRVSTKEQCESLETQEAICRKSIPENAEVIVFRDTKSGGRSFEKRVELQEGLDLLKKGDCFIVYKLDRLTRDFNQLGYISTVISMKKANLISATEKDLSRAMQGFTAVMSDIERQKIRERTRDALQQRKSTGRRAGHVPYGFMAVEDEKLMTQKLKPVNWIHENFEERSTLEQMLRLTDQGLSLSEVATALNEQGKVNRAGGLHHVGAPWSRYAIHRLLKRAKSLQGAA